MMKVGLGGQHVHHLGPGDAGDELHGERAGLRLGETVERSPVLVGVERRQHHGAGLQRRDLLGVRTAHLEQHVGLGQRVLQGFGDGRAGGGVIGVKVGGGRAGAGFDGHLEARGDQLLDRFRRRGDPGFGGPAFPGDGDDSHEAPLRTQIDVASLGTCLGDDLARCRAC
jgi:hypothetical protein